MKSVRVKKYELKESPLEQSMLTNKNYALSLCDWNHLSRNSKNLGQNCKNEFEN
jgi:hypothetical protein